MARSVNFHPVKFVFLTLAFLWSLATFAQGIISVNNRNLIKGGNVPISLSNGGPPGPDYVAQLYLAGSDGGFTPLSPTVRFRDGSFAAAYFLDGPVDVVVPGIGAGIPVTFRLRVFESRYGTYENAVASGGCTGESNDIYVPSLLVPPSVGLAPFTPPDLSGLMPFTVTCGMNHPPEIAPVPDQTTVIGSSISVPIVVTDYDTPSADLTVTATSGNTSLVPNENIAISGTGTNRQVNVVPARCASGRAEITVKVSDGNTQASTAFIFTVIETGAAPVLSPIPNRVTFRDTPIQVPITVHEPGGCPPVESSGFTASSADQALVPATSVVFSGEAVNGTVLATVTPSSGKTGSTSITVRYSDGESVLEQTFTLFVLPLPELRPAALKTGILTIGYSADMEALVTIEESSDLIHWDPVSANVTASASFDFPIAAAPALFLRARLSSLPVANLNDSPPRIEAIPDQLTAEASPLDFEITLSDPDTPPEQLHVRAMSSAPGLISAEQVVVSGSGSVRQVRLRPVPCESGKANVTLIVDDGIEFTSVTFAVTVFPILAPPVLERIVDKTTGVNTPLTFDVIGSYAGATEDNAGFYVRAVDERILPPENVVLVRTSATSARLTLTPGKDQIGQTTVRVEFFACGGFSSGEFVFDVVPPNNSISSPGSNLLPGVAE